LGFGGLKPYLDNNKISIKQNVGNVLGYGHFWGRLAPKAPPSIDAYDYSYTTCRQ